MSVTEEFFFIDSNYLECTVSRLYGFCIDSEGRDLNEILNDAQAYTLCPGAEQGKIYLYQPGLYRLLRTLSVP